MSVRLVLLPIFALVSFAAEAPFQDLSYEQALAAAGKEKKVVLIDFFTTWCGPCKKLDKTTWKDPDVQKWLAAKTVALKIDAEKQVELAKRFALPGYPTIVFVKPDGKEVGRIVGYRDPKKFLEDAQAALGGKDPVERARDELAGKENDPRARAGYAEVLAQAGRADQALAEYLWCFDHGLVHQPGYSGVRRTFLLSQIAELGRRYPPALQALETRRDEAETELLAGKELRDVARDVAALNKYLKAEDKTLALYDRLEKADLLTDELRSAFLPEVGEMLAEARRYADLMRPVGDVDAWIDARLKTIAAITPQEGSDEESRRSMQAALASMKQGIVEDSSLWYEALLGTDKKDQAARIAEKLIAYAPSGSTYAVLIRRAVHAGADDEARALAERGRSSLPEKDQLQVSQAAQKIHAPK